MHSAMRPRCADRNQVKECLSGVFSTESLESKAMNETTLIINLFWCFETKVLVNTKIRQPPPSCIVMFIFKYFNCFTPHAVANKTFLLEFTTLKLIGFKNKDSFSLYNNLFLFLLIIMRATRLLNCKKLYDFMAILITTISWCSSF